MRQDKQERNVILGQTIQVTLNQSPHKNIPINTHYLVQRNAFIRVTPIGEDHYIKVPEKQREGSDLSQ